MLGAAFVCAGSARAATKVWAGGSNSTWSTAANWVGSSAPTSSDTAAFKGWIPLVSSGWTVTASNTYMTFAASNTKDNTLDTFWMTGANQASGMYVIINLGSAQTFSGIDIDSSPAYPNDYPRGFDIYVSSNGSTWGSPIASGTGSDHFTSVTFDEQTYQYIKIQLDTSYGSAWWTIAELTVWNTADSVGTKLSRTGWTLTAHNTDGASPLANAIDSDPATRWANGAAQLSGHWFKVDLGTTTSVTGILLDAYDDVDDYLRQYTLAYSTDNTNWTNIQSSVSNTKAYLLHTFSAVNARYLRVTLTTGSGGPWWCIGDVQVFGTPNTANIAADTTIAALELSKGVTITQAAGADLTVTGSFTASAGTFTGSTGTVTIGGSMTISGATFTGGSGNVYVAGDFTFSSGTFTAPSGLLQVTGAFSRTNGTFTHNSGRVLLSSSSSKTFATGGVTFNSVYVNDGLVGYWNLDEGAGSSIADSSGWGHTGTLYNTPTWAAGPTTPSFTNASSMVVNGTTQYARISRTTALEPTAVSVSVWVKRNGAQTQYGKVLGKVYANNASTIPYATYALQMNQNNTDSGLITFHTGHTAGAQSALNSTAGAIADGVWTHVLATYDPAGSAPQKKLYINGVLNASATITTALLYDSTSNGDLYFGTGVSSQYFKGTIDDVRIYSRALTAADAALLANGGQRTTPSATQTLSGALTTASDLVIASGTLDVSATGCSSAPCAVSVSGDWTNYGGTFTHRNGTVTFSGSGGGNITSDRNEFYGLTIGGTGTWTLKDRLKVSNLLTFSAAGTLANGGYTVRAANVTKSSGTLSGSGSLVLDASSAKSLTLNSSAMPVRIESPLDDGLVGYWKFDDGRGTTVTDHSGNGNNGTVNGSAPFTTDVPSSPIDNPNAMVFDGTTQYVHIGTPAVLNFSGQITMAAWVKLNATDGFRNIIGHGDSDSPVRDTFLRVVSGNYRVGTYYAPTDAYAEYAIPGGDIGTWVHLVGVNDGTNWILYRNGVQVASQSGSSGAYTATTNWRIGSQGSSASRFFSGSIDDVRIYNRGLSPNEVAALYNYGYTTGSTVIYSLAATTTMGSTFKIDSGILNAVSYANTITGAATVNGGTYIVGSNTTGQTFTAGLQVNRYGELHLLSSGGKALFGTGSTFNMDGTLYATNTGAVIEASSGTYNFRVGSVSGATPTLNISGLQVKETTADGMYINYNTGSTTTFTRFDNIAFTTGAGTGAGNYNLSIYATALYLTSSGCSFDGGVAKTVASNVRLIGNGITSASETRAIFGGATCATGVTCESYDADDDSGDDGVGDTTATNGAVVQWIETAATDTAGTIEGFPTAAFNWNTFAYYATYVAYHDTSGTADTVYVRSSTGTASYSWSTSSGEDIIGTPRWDYSGSTKYVYVATTGGKVYQLIDNGSTLTAGTVSPWNGANNPYDCSCTITTPLAQDTSNLYWGGNASGTHKLWTLSKTSTTRLPAGAPLATSTTTNNAAPALWVSSGTTYAYLGLAGRVSKINVTTQANVADNTNPGGTNSVTGRITVVHNALYAGDDNGYLWKLDPGTNFGASSGLYKHWGYNDTTNHAACGGVCQIKNHYYDPTATNVYFGDGDGHLYVINSSGSAKTGYPYRPGTSSDVFQTAPFHRTGVLLAGTTTGTLYIIDQSTNGTTPGLIRKYEFGASTKVSGIAYNPNISSYMVSTANETNKDGKLYYIDVVSDPTSSYP